jgi:hypothetical protein
MAITDARERPVFTTQNTREIIESAALIDLPVRAVYFSNLLTNAGLNVGLRGLIKKARFITS